MKMLLHVYLSVSLLHVYLSVSLLHVYLSVSLLSDALISHIMVNVYFEENPMSSFAHKLKSLVLI